MENFYYKIKELLSTKINKEEKIKREKILLKFFLKKIESRNFLSINLYDKAAKAKEFTYKKT